MGQTPPEPNDVRTPDSGEINLNWLDIGNGAHDLEIGKDVGTTNLATTGQDAYFWFDLPPVPMASRDWVITFDYFCSDGIAGLQWQSGRPAVPDGFVALPNLEPAEGWSTYAANISELDPDAIGRQVSRPVRIDLGRRKGVRLQVRNVRLRPISPAELETQRRAEAVRQKKQDLANLIREDRSHHWPTTIDKVRVEKTAIHFQGRADDNWTCPTLAIVRRSDTQVVGLPISDAETSTTWPVQLNRSTHRWSATVSSESIDVKTLAGSRWQLVRKQEDVPRKANGRWEAVSAVRFVAQWQRGHAAIPAQATLHAAKGITCVTQRYSSQDLRELGLKHASVNVILNGLLRTQDGPRPSGYRDVKIHGTSWWLAEDRLQRLDQNVRVCTDAGLQVAGILLIANRSGKKDPLAHHEADPAGTYVMPDLNDPDSRRLYAATLDLLADRYGGSKPQHGRIDHWIVHNEVDYGWQWTNMGEQPFEIFMDHYVRSMRMVDAAVRAQNPLARVFISLTHRWNVPDDRPWKTYAPREMLRWLTADSKRHGDFAWGVAYHPYPQSLWKADTWNDTQISDDFDTKLITIKNIQVLDRFMHEPDSRDSSGELRPVILSEQGFHADMNNPDQLRTQAAALLYTFEKIRGCASVLAFDYHRPNDHPNEGGLLLGLRGFPTKENPRGIAKPAWNVYQAIHTPDEQTLRDQYSELWSPKPRLAPVDEQQ